MKKAGTLNTSNCSKWKRQHHRHLHFLRIKASATNTITATITMAARAKVRTSTFSSLRKRFTQPAGVGSLVRRIKHGSDGPIWLAATHEYCPKESGCCSTSTERVSPAMRFSSDSERLLWCLSMPKQRKTRDDNEQLKSMHTVNLASLKSTSSLYKFVDVWRCKREYVKCIKHAIPHDYLFNLVACSKDIRTP